MNTIYEKSIFVINNYQKGAKLKSSPVHKIVNIIPLGSNHHKVTYKDLTHNEWIFINKLFGRKI